MRDMAKVRAAKGLGTSVKRIPTRPSKSRQLRLYLKYMDFSEANISPITGYSKNPLQTGTIKRSYVTEIKNICTDCVGDDYEGQPSRLIKACKITECPLHCVRPSC